MVRGAGDYPHVPRVLLLIYGRTTHVGSFGDLGHRNGFGAEVVDMVKNKYITWFCDTNDPMRTPGASCMKTPGKKFVSWYWTIALIPIDDSKRCRIIQGWDTAFGPHSFVNWYSERFIIGCGGAMMSRRMFRNLELSVRREEINQIAIERK